MYKPTQNLTHCCCAMECKFQSCRPNTREMVVIWKTFENGSQSTNALLPYICLLFSWFSNVYHFACVWPTPLKLGCITNFDMLFLVMRFISLVDEIQFMLTRSRHICTRSYGNRSWSLLIGSTKKVRPQNRVPKCDIIILQTFLFKS